MSEGVIQIYYGEGHGKSTAAVGTAIHMASLGKKTVIIQYMKGKNEAERAFFAKLEPEIRYFNFAKADSCYNSLNEEMQQEERMNLRNGFYYGRKVITTGDTDVVVLDELLGLEDQGIVSFEEIRDMLRMKPEDMSVIITGRVLDDRFRMLADEIYNIAPEK